MNHSLRVAVLNRWFKFWVKVLLWLRLHCFLWHQQDRGRGTARDKAEASDKSECTWSQTNQQTALHFRGGPIAACSSQRPKALSRPCENSHTCLRERDVSRMLSECDGSWNGLNKNDNEDKWQHCLTKNNTDETHHFFGSWNFENRRIFLFQYL